MPEISRFFGIIIAMYWDEHEPPHFHAKYNEYEALIDIKEGIIIQGMLPSKQARLVLAWLEIHKEELLNNWESILAGKGYSKIAPLS